MQQPSSSIISGFRESRRFTMHVDPHLPHFWNSRIYASILQGLANLIIWSYLRPGRTRPRESSSRGDLRTSRFAQATARSLLQRNEEMQKKTVRAEEKFAPTSERCTRKLDESRAISLRRSAASRERSWTTIFTRCRGRGGRRDASSSSSSSSALGRI